MGTPVTPNHLTALRLATGLAAAAAFAAPAPGWLAGGIGLLTLSLLFDRADGELARLSGRTTASGHRYDLIADGISNGAVFVGIGAGLTHGALGGMALVLGAIAGTAMVAAEILVMRLDRTGVRSSAELGGRWGFDPDDAMFLVPVGLALGWGEQVLIAASAAGPLVVALFLVMAARSRPPRDVPRNAREAGRPL